MSGKLLAGLRGLEPAPWANFLPILAPADEKVAFYTHAGNASVDQTWETPPELLASLHRVFGRFDLDPALLPARPDTKYWHEWRTG